MAYVVVLNQKSMVVRIAVTAFLTLVAAAYAEDRFHHADWCWFGYSVCASLALLFLTVCAVSTLSNATK